MTTRLRMPVIVGLGMACLGMPAEGQSQSGALAGADGRLRVGVEARGEGGIRPDRSWTGRVVRHEVQGEACTAIQITVEPGRPALPPVLVSRVRELQVRGEGSDPWIRVHIPTWVAREPAVCRSGG